MKPVTYFVLMLLFSLKLALGQDWKLNRATLFFENPPKNSTLLFYDSFGEFNLIELKDSLSLESSENKFYLEIENSKNYQVILLNAGDKIKYRFVNDFWIPIGVSKEKEAELRFFEHFRRIIEKDTPVFEGWIFQRALLTDEYIKNPQYRNKTLGDRYTKNLSFLNKYHKENQLSDDFYKKWKAYFDNKHMELYSHLGNKIALFPQTYFDKILNAKDTALHKKMIYMKQYQFVCTNFLELVKYKKYSNKNISFNQTIELIKENFSDQDRDFLILGQIIVGTNEDYKTGFDLNEIEAYIPKYIAETKNEEYKKYLLGILKTQKNEAIATHLDVLNTENVEINIKEIAKNAKLTYIDIWASWCAPCIAEMKYSRKLKTEYDPNEIQFVYVSIDENSYKWSKANQQLQLNNSYLDHNGNIAKQFKIMKIPRYILLNQKGDTIDKNAPRPSDEKIKPYLKVKLK
ncbi:MAG: hypothetical protein C4K58_05290 [Flavobacteriaceae bacterium]|nr:MAG: hypothetical protein C4K58_05290 [Flavobacteriaceae bacterium]